MNKKEDYYKLALSKTLDITRRYIYTVEKLYKQACDEHYRGVRQNKPRISEHGKARMEFYKDQHDKLKKLEARII